MKFNAKQKKALPGIIKKCKAKGWRWCKTGVEGQKIFIPPECDPRSVWCACWIPYKKGYRVPHWISPDDIRVKSS